MLDTSTRDDCTIIESSIFLENFTNFFEECTLIRIEERAFNINKVINCIVRDYLGQIFDIS